MTIMETVIEDVSNGSRFYVDFENRDLKVGGKYLIEKGEVKGETEIDRPPERPVLDVIQELYDSYKVSYPSGRNTKKKKRYFKCLAAEDMTDKQMILGEDRELAQAKLEAYVLISILNGSLTWTEDMGSWFWQGNNELVLMRKWVEING